MKKTVLSFAAIATMGMAMAQNPFPAINENFYDASKHPTDLTEIMIPASPLKYDVLFTGGVDMVSTHDGKSALAKEWHDFTGFVPINGRSDSGYVIVNHEMMVADPLLGDGGGMTVFTVYYNQNTKSWEVVNDPNGKYRNVDFSEVGGTGANCGGIQTSWGRVFTAEEWGSAFTSNEVINLGGQGITDTADWMVKTFNGQTVNRSIKKYQNFQYMVEVDVKAAKAIRKNYNMGRYDHERGWIASDRKTVYLSDDYSEGAIIFKFVADKPEDFSKGQLYAYKQSADGMTGEWVALPMTLDAMMNAREEAWKLGATCFMRLEWVEGINDETIFITETGRGRAQSVKPALRAGGTLANHLVMLDAADGKLDSSFSDIFGRVLRLNTRTGKVEVALEGGGSLNNDYTPTGNHLSSPDGLTSTVINGRVFLAINEDMNPGGMPANPRQFSNVLNEVYILEVTGDHQGKTYTSNDLIRFAVGPKGCETTGGRFTPDGSTYFLNIQHPSTSNKPPFNHSVTVAITGYAPIFDQSFFTAVEELQANKEGFELYPNPATRELFLNKKSDIAIYDMQGKRVMVQRNVNRVDIHDLATGTYTIVNAEGQAKKLIVQ
ncbi:MAG: DUF839 domain-containing protein [Flavobacteriales bacterium]|nr:DUF839 domain-containing protein [Flavobacteriales bacterium]